MYICFVICTSLSCCSPHVCRDSYVLFHRLIVLFCHSKETKRPVTSLIFIPWNIIVAARFRSEDSPCRVFRRHIFTVTAFPKPIRIPSVLNIRSSSCIWTVNSSAESYKTPAHITPKLRRGINRLSVDKEKHLDVTFCIIYFSSNSCSTCFGQPCAHHQVLTTA